MGSLVAHVLQKRKLVSLSCCFTELGGQEIMIQGFRLKKPRACTAIVLFLTDILFGEVIVTVVVLVFPRSLETENTHRAGLTR